VEKAWGYDCINNKRTKVTFEKVLEVKSSYIGNKKDGKYYFLGRYPIGILKHYVVADSPTLKYYIYKDTFDRSPELHYRVHYDSTSRVTPDQIDSVNKLKRQRIIDSVTFVRH
jgi:hypothetical protein